MIPCDCATFSRWASYSRLSAQAAVTRVEITERADLPVAGFERISGKLHFALDPKLPANKNVVDLALAPKNGQGHVEFASDFLVFRPKDAAKSNGTALLEIVNRGRTQMWSMLNSGANSNMRTLQDFGDNFLLKSGYTVILVGWQWDIADRPGNFKVYAPVVPNVTGPVRMEIIPNAKQVADSCPTRWRMRTPDRSPYAMRRTDRTTIPKTQWHYSADQKQIEFPLWFLYRTTASCTRREPRGHGIGNKAACAITSRRERYPGLCVIEVEEQPCWNAVTPCASGAEGLPAAGRKASRLGRETRCWRYSTAFRKPATTGAIDHTGSMIARLLLGRCSQQCKCRAQVVSITGLVEYRRAAALIMLARMAKISVSYTGALPVAGTQHGGGGGGPPTTQNLTNSMEWTYILRATITNLNAWVTSNSGATGLGVSPHGQKSTGADLRAELPADPRLRRGELRLTRRAA